MGTITVEVTGKEVEGVTTSTGGGEESRREGRGNTKVGRKRSRSTPALGGRLIRRARGKVMRETVRCTVQHRVQDILTAIIGGERRWRRKGWKRKGFLLNIISRRLDISSIAVVVGS